MEEIETSKREKQKKQTKRCKGLCESIRGSSLFIGGIVMAQKTSKKSAIKGLRKGGIKG